MAFYSKKSAGRLNSCHRMLKAVFTVLIKFFDHTVLNGYRGELLQEELFEKGLSKLHYPDSQHNKVPSRAVDVMPYYHEEPHLRWVSKDDLMNCVKQADRKEFKKQLEVLLVQYHFAGMVKGIAWAQGASIRWGGDWDGDFKFNDQSFDDLGHFELEGAE